MKTIKGPKPWHRFHADDDIPTMREYAKKGEPDACLSYANHLLYETEDLLAKIRQKRLEKARRLFKQAIDEADEKDKWLYVLNLARTYNEKNYDEAAIALQLYEEAARYGSVSGMVMAAQLYTRGWGVPKDYTKAAEYMRKAAETGCLA